MEHILLKDIRCVVLMYQAIFLTYLMIFVHFLCTELVGVNKHKKINGACFSMNVDSVTK